MDNSLMDQFIEELEESQIRIAESNDTSLLLNFEMDGGRYSVSLDFSETSYFQLMVFNYAKAPKNQVDRLIPEINRINSEYDCAQFAINDDGSIFVSMEGILLGENHVSICYRMLSSICTIVEEAYPTLMKAIWA